MWFNLHVVQGAADLKDARALTACGLAYLTGRGVGKSETRGLIMIGVAAGMGSEHACGVLGHANARGIGGIDKDPQEATRWFREMQKCDQRDSGSAAREEAAAWLHEHP